MNQIIEDLVNFLFPAECHVCGIKLTSGEKFVCKKCVASLPRTGFHRNKHNPMEERFAGIFPFEKATGLFFYSKGSPLSQLIQDMKYRAYPDIGLMLGGLAYKELFSTGFYNGIDYIVPLPMHWFKRAKRGYNQTDMIARGISQESGLAVCNELKMVRSHKTQTRLGREQRMKNIKSLFDVRRKHDLNGKGVLLIDDICTTGSTIAEAGSTLCDKYPDIRLSVLTIGVTF